MTRKLNVTVTPSAELLCAIAITAAENGINYWAEVTKYQWQESMWDVCKRLHLPFSKEFINANKAALEQQRLELPFPVVTIEPKEDPDEYAGVTLTAEHVLDGLEQALIRDTFYANGKAATILRAIATDDAADLDTEICDCIVQLGLFNDVVYG